ncbi:hypothetical protein HHK36_028207 [Tetracentron sinense]|uniref:DUF4283 domain-containing protein n=1 Tax=Tetracentron sinense TaxID=13715 RepID=A0A834YIT6_TETSI|nr:hypothetical protein HHK36_028207 [Tetracentron sinense]
MEAVNMGGRSPPRPLDLPKISYAEAVGNAMRSRLGHHKDLSFNSINDVKQSATFQSEPELFYTEEELKISAAGFQKVLIAKFAYGRSSIEVLKNYIQGTFHTKFSIYVGILYEKHQLIRFESKEDFISVWLKESCYGDGQLVRFIKWTPLFQADDCRKGERKSGIGTVMKKSKGMGKEVLNKEKKRGDMYTDPIAKESTARWVEKTFEKSKQNESNEQDKQTVILNTAVAGKDEEEKHTKLEFANCPYSRVQIGAIWTQPYAPSMVDTCLRLWSGTRGSAIPRVISRKSSPVSTPTLGNLAVVPIPSDFPVKREEEEDPDLTLISKAFLCSGHLQLRAPPALLWPPPALLRPPPLLTCAAPVTLLSSLSVSSNTIVCA